MVCTDSHFKRREATKFPFTRPDIASRNFLAASNFLARNGIRHEMLSALIYCLFAACLFGLGVAVGRSSKAYALLPFVFAAWTGAAVLSHFARFDFIEAIAAAFLAGSILQIGYMVGAHFSIR
jgi:hypothetical protein